MVLNYPGVGWLVVYETTTISFVLERAIGWDGTETVFVVRESLERRRARCLNYRL
jgi:hypothetical protein